MDVLNESFSDPASLKREVRFGLFFRAKLVVTICKTVGLCEAKLHQISRKPQGVWHSENSGVKLPPNHPILIGFSITFTIHFGVKNPLFLETPHSVPTKKKVMVGCQKCLISLPDENFPPPRSHRRRDRYSCSRTCTSLSIKIMKLTRKRTIYTMSPHNHEE